MSQDNSQKSQKEESKTSEKTVSTDKKMDLIEDDKQIELGPIFSDNLLKKTKKVVTKVTLAITNSHLVISDRETLKLHYTNILGASEREPESDELECCQGREKEKLHMFIIHCYSKVTSKPLFGKPKTYRQAFVKQNVFK